MSSVTPGADTLMSTSLGQSSSLLPLKGQNAIAAPTAAAPIEGVAAGSLTSRALTGIGGAAQTDGKVATAAGLLLRGEQPGGVPASSINALLTRGGSLIQALFLDYPEAPASVAGMQPLIPKNTPLPAELAQSLASEVEYSGMFYESHLSAYLTGGRSLSDMAREPQVWLGMPEPSPNVGEDVRSQLLTRLQSLQGPASANNAENAEAASPLAGALVADAAEGAQSDVAAAVLSAANGAMASHASEHDDTADVADGRDSAALRQQSDKALSQNTSTEVKNARTVYIEEAYGVASPLLARNELKLIQEAIKSSASETMKDGQQPDGPRMLTGPPIHPAAELIVRQQLELLATQTWRWQGELAAGVDMQWEISQRKGEGGDNSDAEAAGTANWVSKVSVTLPSLGKVDFQIHLSANTLATHLQGASDEAVHALQERAAELRERLHTLGLARSTLDISLAVDKSNDRAEINI